MINKISLREKLLRKNAKLVYPIQNLPIKIDLTETLFKTYSEGNISGAKRKIENSSIACKTPVDLESLTKKSKWNTKFDIKETKTKEECILLSTYEEELNVTIENDMFGLIFLPTISTEEEMRNIKSPTNSNEVKTSSMKCKRNKQNNKWSHNNNSSPCIVKQVRFCCKKTISLNLNRELVGIIRKEV